ncbi:MAG TPA: flagellar basal body rod protein FlgC [Candidatus Sulfotelmatobacter sp.]|nr:flagellar basal body rod protein FlgC [Candidatus Sulfotelmatobacter sp.]
MDLSDVYAVAASGMKAQGSRLRVISENLANANSTSQTPGGEPYRRKVISFGNVLDRTLDAQVVKVRSIGPDRSDFELKYDPSNPAANADGYVMLPNVNPIIEMADMREAQRSYDANLSVIETTTAMVKQVISVLNT